MLRYDIARGAASPADINEALRSLSDVVRLLDDQLAAV